MLRKTSFLLSLVFALFVVAGYAGEGEVFPADGEVKKKSPVEEIEKGWKLYLEKGDLHGAEKAFAEAAAKGRGNPLVEMSLASMAADRGLYDEYVKHMLTVLSSDYWGPWLESSLSDFKYLSMYYDNLDEIVKVFERRVLRDRISWIEKSLVEQELSDFRLMAGNVDGAVKELSEQPYVRQWLVLGPFNNREREGFNVERDFEKDFTHLDLSKKHDCRGRNEGWFVAKTDWGGKLDLSSVVSPGSESVAYAVTYIKCEEDIEGTVVVGTGGASCLWVNGQKVYVEDIYHSFKPLQRLIPVKLVAGLNQIVFKVAGERDGECALAARVLALSPAELAQPGSAEKVEKARRLISYSVELKDAVEYAKGYAIRIKPKVNFDAKVNDGEYGLDWGGMAFFSKYSVKHANSVLALVGKAGLLLDYGVDDDKYKRSRPLLEKAVEAAPNCPLVLGLASRVQQDENESRKLVEKAIKVSPESYSCRELLLGKLEDGGFLREADKKAHEILKAQPSSRAWDVIASVNTARGWKEESLAAHRKSLELAPYWSHKLVEIADLADGTDETLAGLRSAYKKAPDMYVRMRLAGMLDSLKHYDEAINLYREMVVISPFDEDAWKSLSDVYRAKGDMGRAIEVLREARDWMPQSSQLIEWIGRLRLEKGETSVAMKLFKKALTIKRDNPDLEAYLKYLEPKKKKFYEDYDVAYDDLQKKDASPEDYPRYNILTLLDLAYVKVNPNGTVSKMVHTVQKVLRRPGIRDASTHSIGYMSDRQKAEVIKARVIQPDGQVIDNPQIHNSGGGGRYGPGSTYGGGYGVTYVRLPQVREGSIIEVQYTIEDTKENVYLDEFEDGYYVGGLNPCALFTYTLDLPDTKEVIYNISNMKKGELDPVFDEKAVKPGRKTMTWRKNNIAGVEIEPMMPPFGELLPQLRISTFKSWDKVAKFVWSLSKEQMELPDDIKKETNDLVKDCKTRDDKIRAVYDFIINKIRYVSISYGQHGYKPHKVERTYRARYGDCKDTALLFVAMLNEVGVDANFVLVRTYNLGKELTGIPGLRLFNHAICYISPEKDGGKGYWLDGTTDYFTLGQIPMMDRDTEALVVSSESGKMMTIDNALPEQNIATESFKVMLAPGGKGKMTYKNSVTGEQASAIKRALETPKKIETVLDRVLNQRIPGSKTYNFTYSKDKDDEAWLAFDVSSNSLAQKQGEAYAFKAQLMPMSLAGTASLKERKQDMFLVSLCIDKEMDVEIILPKNAEIVSIPEDKKFEYKFGSYERKTIKTDTGLKMRSSLVLNARRIAQMDYAKWREFCIAVDAVNEEVVLFKGGEAEPKGYSEFAKDNTAAEATKDVLKAITGATEDEEEVE